MREFPKDKQCGENLGNRAQYESLAPQSRVAFIGGTSGTGGGENRLRNHLPPRATEFSKCWHEYDQSSYF